MESKTPHTHPHPLKHLAVTHQPISFS
ncbi:hypothetical protein PanWU01x14_117740 [Parasponia andersonii]|uniref:Uncharacterized protein n=1 Tax=Parasponia andersonii TaxID=3476 RepID=A0A2P5CW55_PARAD|nr:hypothetical protein PanWU01x14_117740 [Parasponia andersonii]